MSVKNVLVTGGAGYIGSRLVPLLLSKGYKVTVLDILQYKEPSLLQYCDNRNFSFVRGDASHSATIISLLAKNDVIIPLAGIVGAPACKLNPNTTMSVNLEAIKIIVSNMSVDQKLIYPTTNSGYGIGDGEEFCTEESPLRPLSLYGTTKVDAEKAILDSGNGISFRLATVFGTSPRMRWDLLVNDFTLRAMQDRCLILFEQNFRRNFIHIKDVCDTFLFGLSNYESMNNDCFNLGLSEANLTKRELAEKIKSVIPELVIISSEIGTDPDKRDYIVSNEKLESNGWRPSYSLEDGISELAMASRFVPLKAGSNV